ncbi:MAG: 4Fe-4S dicluster domain-containing protein [Vampirovibrio sp.]|jgi:ferredoxin|nr:4Fe-4S dicluster domain-containing protein [Vampirovibrio sp.]
MPFVIGEACVNVKDKACVGVCPVDCIYEFDGEPQLYIHPDECIECGACGPVCPVNAIFLDSEMPESQTQYIELNAKVTAEKC